MASPTKLRLNRWLIAAVLTVLFLDSSILLANKPERAKAGNIRTLIMDERHLGVIRVGRTGTIINFPVKPTKVIIGQEKSFQVEYVETDIAIASTASSGSSNMYVYMLGRRYGFVLVPVASGADDVVVVEDAWRSKDATR